MNENVTTAPAAARPAASRFVGTVLALALAAGILITGAAPAHAAPPAPADAELEFLQRMNAARADNGQAPMKSDSLIVPIAREWSDAMARSANLSHRTDLRHQIETRVTRDWARIGENVGRGGGVESLHNAFMNSPGHRANVLGDYNRVGIGVVNSGNTIWVTFNFLKGADINGPTGAEAAQQTPPAQPAPAPAPAPAPEPDPSYKEVTTRGIDHACPSSKTPDTRFVDLAGSVHRTPVGCAAWWGVANGKTDTLYVPNGLVTRGQLASFVARMVKESGRMLPLLARDAFDDDDGSVHEKAINQLAALGVVSGVGNRSFGPNQLVTRAAMATILVRAHDLVADTALTAGTDAFADDNGTTHEANINKVAAAGLAGGTSRGIYDPAAGVRRGQMATFLARTIDLLVTNGDTAAR